MSLTHFPRIGCCRNTYLDILIYFWLALINHRGCSVQTNKIWIGIFRGKECPHARLSVCLSWCAQTDRTYLHLCFAAIDNNWQLFNQKCKWFCHNKPGRIILLGFILKLQCSLCLVLPNWASSTEWENVYFQLRQSIQELPGIAAQWWLPPACRVQQQTHPGLTSAPGLGPNQNQGHWRGTQHHQEWPSLFVSHRSPHAHMDRKCREDLFACVPFAQYQS